MMLPSLLFADTLQANAEAQALGCMNVFSETHVPLDLLTPCRPMPRPRPLGP
jgi:hypothetical protein